MSLFIAGNLSVPSFVLKSADQIVNNSTALVDDLELKFTGEADAVYYILLNLLYSAASDADMDIAYSVPAGAAMDRTLMSVGAIPVAAASERSIGGAGATNKIGAVEWAVLTMGSVPGDIQLQWAQNVAQASDATMRKNSSLAVWQIA